MCYNTRMSSWTPIEHNGKPARLYPDGSIRNERGHWLAVHPGGTQITHETASTLAEHRYELKRQRVQAGANAALKTLQRKTPTGMVPVWERPQDLDFVEAIAEAQTSLALSPNEPGSTRGADWVMRHSGLGEQQPQDDSPEAEIGRALIRELARRARAMGEDNSNYREHSAGVVDALP